MTSCIYYRKTGCIASVCPWAVNKGCMWAGKISPKVQGQKAEERDMAQLGIYKRDRKWVLDSD